MRKRDIYSQSNTPVALIPSTAIGGLSFRRAHLVTTYLFIDDALNTYKWFSYFHIGI